MITQNPIIGRAKKKLAGVYSRTLYGKNVLQTCPPPTKGKQHPKQIAACTSFGYLSRLSNQVSASLLNNIFYQAPVGRSRRAEWMQQLCKGQVKNGLTWDFNPDLIPQLGTNPTVTEAPMTVTPAENQLRFNVAEFSAVGDADLNKTPCLILICKDTAQCISLLPWTTLDGEEIVLTNLSPTFLHHECLLYCLWQVNISNNQTPIYVYGRFNVPE